MKPHFIGTVNLIFILLAIPFEVCANTQENASQQAIGGLLLSSKQEYRRQALESLMDKRHMLNISLLAILGEATAEFRNDHRFHSPLHVAIVTVADWQVLSADTLLFPVIDYHLDSSSFPLGMDVPGPYFYPAANALVNLRVDVSVVIQEIARSKDARTLRILTWVLLERTKDVDIAKILLNHAFQSRHGTTEKQNLHAAIDLLEDPANLLQVPEDININPSDNNQKSL